MNTDSPGPKVPSSLSSASSPAQSPLPEVPNESPTTIADHITHLTTLRAQANLPALRKARNLFAASHPLPPPHWHIWLSDELSLCPDNPARKHLLLQLFPSALADYPCPDVHHLRLQVAISLADDGLLEPAAISRYFQEAVQSGAVAHFLKGAPLLHLYKHFLAKQQPASPEEQTAAQTEQQLIFKLEQLPARERAAADDELAERIAACEQFEKRLAAAESDIATSTSPEQPGAGSDELAMQYRLYALYAGTISGGLETGVHERAVMRCFGRGDVWRGYLRCVARREGEGERLYEVGRRAGRAVPDVLEGWLYGILGASSAEIVVEMVRRMERFVMVSTDYAGAERIVVGMWMVYERMGKKGRDVLREVVEGGLRFNVRGSREWGRACCFAGRVLWESGEREKAREVFEEVVGTCGQGGFWVEYGRVVGGEEGRAVFRRGVGKVVGREVGVVERGWVEFERRVGGGQMAKVYSFVGERMERMGGAGEVVGKGRRERLGKDRGLPKRKRLRVGADGKGMEKETGAQRKDKEKGADRKDHADGMEVEPKVEELANGETGAERRVESKKKQSAVEPRTIFVTNIGFGVTEEDLRKEFGFAGGVVEVRLLRRSDGASKGKAYIEFETEDNVDKALERHLKPVCGRVAWVRRSRPLPGRARGQRRVDRGRARRQVVDVEMGDGEVGKEEEMPPARTQAQLRAMFLGE